VARRATVTGWPLHVAVIFALLLATAFSLLVLKLLPVTFTVTTREP
jgi:hypothetical protein